MTRLYLVTEGARRAWVAALIDEDIWTYVVNTGRFHRNDGLRHDFFMLRELGYTDIGLAEARRLIASGVGTIDGSLFPDSLEPWLNDTESLSPDEVFAAHIADLA
ncbi:hypothetical protein [Kribbella monticola]|uniref:hypothetical protein n=1 Tax=Kribbella monticola TaxID=2185285 RepID=UPI000DD41B8D|nr:hypothetical protein [Kribbella monticola]